MKEKLKGLVVGIIIGALLVPTVFATVGTVTKELSYNNIKITMDGSEVKPTDASGNYVEPFIIDGTTYLPVRGIANALDLGVEWDGATNTVKLSSDRPSDGGSGATGTKLQVGEVIFNEAGIKVTLTEIEDGKYGIWYRFLIENSTDYQVSFYGRDMSVNDYMVSADFGADDIQPHKKATTQFFVSIGENSPGKISEVEKIEIKAEYRVYEKEMHYPMSKDEKTIILTK